MKFTTLLETFAPFPHRHSPPDLHNPELLGLASLEMAQSGDLSLMEPWQRSHLTHTAASALILPPDNDAQDYLTQRGIAWIATTTPRRLMTEAIALFYQPFRPTPEIHPTAIIDPAAEIGDDVYIGPYVVIYARAKLGKGVCVFPHVVIYPEVEIGDRTLLHAHCVIHERSQIGADCIIHSGAVIGAEGFGFVPDLTGWRKTAQAGRAVLEDQVEVGCHSAIDRAELGETRIGQGTKIDNLVQVAHNCRIGNNGYVSAQAGLARGVQVGNNVRILGQAGIANHVTIGSHARITAKAGVIGDLAPHSEVAGFPAQAIAQWRRTEAIKRRLPQIYRKRFTSSP